MHWGAPARLRATTVPDLPIAQLVHWAPPRARLRIESKRRDAAYFSALARELKECSAIASATVNCTTASVAVNLCAPLNTAAEWAQEKGLFALSQRPENMAPLDESITESLAPLGRLAGRASGGAVSLETMMFLTLLCIGMAQIARGNILPGAASLFCLAVDVLRKAARRQAAASRSWSPPAAGPLGKTGRQTVRSPYQ
jgi:hypothetical protein